MLEWRGERAEGMGLSGSGWAGGGGAVVIRE